MFLLDLVAFLTKRPATELLLIPPLAVMAYLLFTRPDDRRASWRGVLILPTTGAILGEVACRLFGLTPWRVTLAAIFTFGAQRLLAVSMPPALAISVLALFLQVRTGYYTLDVAISAAMIGVFFFAWRRWIWERLPAAAEVGDR